MVCHKKRGLAVISAIFALIYSIAMFLTTLLIFVARTLAKFDIGGAEGTYYPENQYALLEKLPFFKDLKVYLDGLKAGSTEYTMAILGTILFLLLSILCFVLVLKMFKSPIKEDGTITYRPWRMFFIALICVAGAATSFLATTKEVGQFNIFGYALTGLGGVSFLFAVLSIFPKKNVFRTKVVIEKKKNQKFSPVVLGVEEKLKKIQQLKDVGAITEAQYNAAVIRLINSI